MVDKLRGYICNLITDTNTISINIYANNRSDAFSIINAWNKKFKNDNLVLDYDHFENYNDLSKDENIELFDDEETLVKYQLEVIEALNKQVILNKINS